MKSQERTGNLPAADSPTRSTDSIWKPFPAHTWQALAMEERSRTQHELLHPVLPVLFTLSVQEQLPGTYCSSHIASRKQSASLQHSSLLKNKLKTALLKAVSQSNGTGKAAAQEKCSRSLQHNLSFYSWTSINTPSSQNCSLILYLKQMHSYSKIKKYWSWWKSIYHINWKTVMQTMTVKLNPLSLQSRIFKGVNTSVGYQTICNTHIWADYNLLLTRCSML